MTTRSPDHRRLALNVLGSRERGRVHLGGDVFAGLAPGSRRMAFDLVQGVRRNTFLLDAVMRQFLERPVRQVPTRLRDALRMGIYELMFHTGVPQAVVVSRIVSLAGRSSNLRGLVNAVLRRIGGSMACLARDEDDRSRDRETVWVGAGRAVRFSLSVLPDPQTDLVSWHALQYSLLRPFVQAYMHLLPFEHEDLFRSLNTPRPVTLRPTRRAGGMERLRSLLLEEDIEALAVRGGVLEISSGGPIGQMQVIQKGMALVQDRTAAETAPFLDPQPGERVLDLCAAPGGKAVHMAELMRDEGEIVATDKSARKLGLLRENADRQGITCIRELEIGSDGSGLPAGPFQRVLVDAPCSNTGVLMRKVDARYRTGDEHLERLETLQLDLLRLGAGRLAPGGTLVYSTCSIVPGENQLLVRRFLSEAPGYRLDEERLRYPHRTQRDGGYMARLRLESGHQTDSG